MTPFPDTLWFEDASLSRGTRRFRLAAAVRELANARRATEFLRNTPAPQT